MSQRGWAPRAAAGAGGGWGVQRPEERVTWSTEAAVLGHREQRGREGGDGRPGRFVAEQRVRLRRGPLQGQLTEGGQGPQDTPEGIPAAEPGAGT